MHCLSYNLYHCSMQKWIFTLAFGLIIVAIPWESKAQHEWGVQGLLGKHANHKNSPWLIDQFTGFHLELNWKKKGKNGWTEALGVQSIGLSTLGFQLKDLKGGHAPIPQGLGQAFAALGHLNIQLIRWNKFSMYFQPGVGVSFHNNTFQNNPENRFMSSMLNNAFMVNIKGTYRINNQWSCLATFRAYHSSNGAVRTPNEGINLVGIGLGILWTSKN